MDELPWISLKIGQHLILNEGIPERDCNLVLCLWVAHFYKAYASDDKASVWPGLNMLSNFLQAQNKLDSLKALADVFSNQTNQAAWMPSRICPSQMTCKKLSTMKNLQMRNNNQVWKIGGHISWHEHVKAIWNWSPGQTAWVVRRCSGSWGSFQRMMVHTLLQL